MTRDSIKTQYPLLDHVNSVANIGITKTPVNVETGITITDAFLNPFVFLIIENNGKESSTMTVKAGNAYPNSMLGDLVMEIPAGVSAVHLLDLERYKKSDDSSLDLDFGEGFNGNIYAITIYSIKDRG